MVIVQAIYWRVDCVLMRSCAYDVEIMKPRNYHNIMHGLPFVFGRMVGLGF